MTPKGKTPSLIGGSLGRPKEAVAGKRCECSRCHEAITKGTKCYDVPQPGTAFSNTRRFCAECYKKVLQQTTIDLTELKTIFDGSKPTGDVSSTA